MDGLFILGYDGTTTGGYNITTSEMGYMYYINLSNELVYPPFVAIPNATFIDGNGKSVSFDLEADVYWSGTAYALDNYWAWDFDFRNGNQARYVKGEHELFAWAVRDGDVTPVPEPTTMLLFGSGLIGLAGLWRKIKNLI